MQGRRTFPHAIFALLTLVLLSTGLAGAASPYTKDVCASGCTYSSVQDAIDDITGSDATHVYTVFIDSGELVSSTSISTGGKDYINFVGRGMGTSVLRASAQWFSNVHAGSTPSVYFDLSDSQGITISGLTVDARTNDGGLYSNDSYLYTGLIAYPPAGGKVTIENCEILGVSYGVWSQGTTGSGGGLVDVLNSKIGAAFVALAPYNITWHVFGTDLRATQTGTASGSLQNLIAAVSSSGTGETTLWGSHVHAETLVDAGTAMKTLYTSVGTISAIGSTVHVKASTSQSSASRRMVAAESGGGIFNLVGSEILYESTSSLGNGRLAGIAFGSAGAYNLAGCTLRDAGGTGGTSRSDLLSLTGASFSGLKTAGTKVSSFISLTGGNPANVAKEFDTLGAQKGAATLSSGTATVTLPVALPDTSYRIAVSAGVNETIYVTGKTATGFTLNSSNAGSTATVDWILMR